MTMGRARLLGAFAFIAAGIVSLEARAIPIEISFSGTVGSVSTWPNSGSGITNPDVGQAFTASFLIETDGWQRSTYSSAESEQISYQTAGAPQLLTGSLMIGGAAVDLSPYADNSGGINFIDTKGMVWYPDGSGSGTPDQFAISLLSTSFPSTWPTDGTFYHRQLRFDTEDWSNFPVDLLSDFVDFSTRTYDPSILATHPFGPEYHLALYDSTVSCASSLCMQAASSWMNLDITTITRTVRSVPEPGTLGLLSLGLLSALVRRRRGSH